jgi:hypothetical protein
MLIHELIRGSLNMFEVSLQLLCTSKSGTLSRVIREINLLTPAMVLTAEKRLSRILGPVASFFVESAAQDSKNAGELFTRLAVELNDQSERDYFLSIIERDNE